MCHREAASLGWARRADVRLPPGGCRSGVQTPNSAGARAARGPGVRSVERDDGATDPPPAGSCCSAPGAEAPPLQLFFTSLIESP
jgi:hypothetical protein